MTTELPKWSPLYGLTEEEGRRYLLLKAIGQCESYDDCPTCQEYAKELREEYADRERHESVPDIERWGRGND